MPPGASRPGGGGAGASTRRRASPKGGGRRSGGPAPNEPGKLWGGGPGLFGHMAGTSVERPLPEIIENNLRALHEVYEGARRHGVKRILFASSNHAIGMHGVDEKLCLDCDVRPDGFYGLSKVWGEAMARMYWDKHGIEGVSLRIGTTMGRPPENFRQLSTWMGTEDLVQLVMKAIHAEDVGYAAVWGISRNARGYYELAEGNAIGYAPTQNAEDWADEILKQPNPLDPVAQRFQGGAFVTIDYTPQDQRPGAQAPRPSR